MQGKEQSCSNPGVRAKQDQRQGWSHGDLQTRRSAQPLPGRSSAKSQAGTFQIKTWWYLLTFVPLSPSFSSKFPKCFHLPFYCKTALSDGGGVGWL